MLKGDDSASLGLEHVSVLVSMLGMMKDLQPSLVLTDGTENVDRDQKTQGGQQRCFQIPERLSYMKVVCVSLCLSKMNT